MAAGVKQGVVVVSEQDQFDLEETIDSYGKFTDAIPARGWKSDGSEFCFLSIDGYSINYACLARRGDKIVTGKRRVTFSDFIQLDDIDFDVVTEQVESKYKHHIEACFKGYGKRIPPATWVVFFPAIKELCPEQAAGLDSLLAKSRSKAVSTRVPGAGQLALEKDAVGVALDIFKGDNVLRQSVLSGVEGQQVLQAPFLECVDAVRLTEEQMLAHDYAVFPDAVATQTTIGTRFMTDENTLDVIYQNRTSVEKALGVDLVYYNHGFDAYTLVQYKRMEMKKDDDTNLNSAVFRPNSDSGFAEEIARMQQFRTSHPDEWEDPKKWKDYRLDGDGFFFKLCPKVNLEPLSAGLLKGMYLPREYLEAILQDGITDGPRGGKIVSYNNVRRYLDNTRFTWAVHNGWVGTRGVSSLEITNVIRDGLSANRAVIYAASADS